MSFCANELMILQRGVKTNLSLSPSLSLSLSLSHIHTHISGISVKRSWHSVSFWFGLNGVLLLESLISLSQSLRGLVGSEHIYKTHHRKCFWSRHRMR